MRKIFFLFFIFLSSHSFAETVFTVAIENLDYTPIFKASSETNQVSGFVFEVLEKFAKAEKIKFKYVPLPINRFIYEVQSGKYDFAFPDNPQWDKLQKIHTTQYYSDPLITFQDAIFVRPEKLGAGIEQFKTVGVMRGFSFWKYKKSVDAGKMKIESSLTPEGLIMMALAGRVDGINLAKQVANYYLIKLNKPNALVSDHDLLPNKDSYYFFSTQKYPEMIKKLNQFLKKESSGLDRMKREYGL